MVAACGGAGAERRGRAQDAPSFRTVCGAAATLLAAWLDVQAALRAAADAAGAAEGHGGALRRSLRRAFTSEKVPPLLVVGVPSSTERRPAPSVGRALSRRPASRRGFGGFGGVVAVAVERHPRARTRPRA